MASEYLRMKARQEAVPREESTPLTGWPKVKNWLHYHMIYLIAGAVVVWIVGSMVWNSLGIGQIRPDYRFACVVAEPLEDALVSELENALATLGEDVNGDGVVRVELTQYAKANTSDAELAAAQGLAASTLLIADITAADSYFFLAEDPERVQLDYQIFANADGTPPADDDFSAEGKVFLWSDCPALRSLAIGSERVQRLYLGRRCFYDEGQRSQHEGSEALWNILTEGAER